MYYLYRKFKCGLVKTFEIGSGVVIDYDTDHIDTTHIGYTFAIYVHFIMHGGDATR